MALTRSNGERTCCDSKLNTLGLLKFYYWIFMPSTYIQIRKLLFNFFWHWKAHLVNYEVYLLPFKNGGPDLLRPSMGPKVA